MKATCRTRRARSWMSTVHRCRQGSAPGPLAGTTTQPGIVAQFHLVDAIFQPEIAERSVWAQQHASDAVMNDQLLEAALAYQELLRAYQLQAIAGDTVASSEKLVGLTTDFAKAGQGTVADADRSNAEFALVETTWRVAKKRSRSLLHDWLR